MVSAEQCLSFEGSRKKEHYFDIPTIRGCRCRKAVAMLGCWFPSEHTSLKTLVVLEYRCPLPTYNLHQFLKTTQAVPKHQPGACRSHPRRVSSESHFIHRTQSLPTPKIPPTLNQRSTCKWQPIVLGYQSLTVLPNCMAPKYILFLWSGSLICCASISWILARS